MRSITNRVRAASLVAFAVGAAILLTGAAESSRANNPNNKQATINDEIRDKTVRKGIDWLLSVQGKDGGWGQDGGETSYVRQGERLETGGNDVANTAVALLALAHNGSTPSTGPHREAARRGVEFILRSVENSPEETLAVTKVTGTQIQRKLGPFIDTFLTSMLLSELDGTLTADQRLNTRVRVSLQKCVRKIQKAQMADGSWNISGGWAPILGTSMASRSLDNARQKGVVIDQAVAARVDKYTKDTQEKMAKASDPATRMGRGAYGVAAEAGSPVAVYADAQALEQLSRTEGDRRANASKIRAIQNKLSDTGYVDGFGSMGGEEFFSYLNISESMHRAGGPEWQKWNGDMRKKLVALQNNDGTWAGHHCITGRVAVTGAAVLTLVADRDPISGPVQQGQAR